MDDKDKVEGDVNPEGNGVAQMRELVRETKRLVAEKGEDQVIADAISTLGTNLKEEYNKANEHLGVDGDANLVPILTFSVMGYVIPRVFRAAGINPQKIETYIEKIEEQVPVPNFVTEIAREKLGLEKSKV